MSGETEAEERKLIAQACTPRRGGGGGWKRTESRSPDLVLKVLGPWVP